jgi:hypothetical protein
MPEPQHQRRREGNPPMSEQSSEVWIGLVHVRPLLGSEDRFNGPGAYTNMLALAASLEDYSEKVTATADADHLVVIAIEDAEPLCERMAEYEVSEEIVNLAAVALGGAVVGDNFFVYLSDEDDEH